MDHILGVGDVHDPAVQPVKPLALLFGVEAGPADRFRRDGVVGAA